MRHGLAVSEFDTDFNRALSSVGQQQANNVANQLKTEGCNEPIEMLVSPFRRTQETAQIVHRELGLDKPFVTEELLVHFGDHKMLADYLLATDKPRLIIISHMPIVAKLCQYLSPGCNISGFQTAQAVRLSFESDESAAIVSKIVLPDT